MRKTLHKAYCALMYPCDVFLARVDSQIVTFLRTPMARRFLVGVCLTYASAGVWLVWSAWLTRSVTELVVGVAHCAIGSAFSTAIAIRLSIPSRIDEYAIRTIRRQTREDLRKMKRDNSEQHSLWDKSDDVVERYVMKAAHHLQDTGFIPFVDGATESDKYERVIAEMAEYFYDEDNAQ